MEGVVLETLSNRKLIVFGVVLLLVQIGFFLIGRLVGESIAFITGAPLRTRLPQGSLCFMPGQQTLGQWHWH